MRVKPRHAPAQWFTSTHFLGRAFAAWFLLALLYASPISAKPVSQQQALVDLFNAIHQSAKPYQDESIGKSIAKLMFQGCELGASQALAKGNLSKLDPQKKAYMQGIMKLTCRCVAEDKVVQRAVIDKALAMKEITSVNQKADVQYKQALLKAKNRCVAKFKPKG